MSTYYNYVKRGTESQVDWGKIGKGLTDEITRISQDREAKRTELDKLNTDLIRSASEVTSPEQDYVRNLVLNGTNEMKNLALTNNNLLKRGVITPAQYRMAMENMSAGVTNLDKASKEFNSSYKKSMERLAKGEMPWEEQQQKEELFKYGNLKDKTLYVAPDGSMYITSIDENGDPVADPRKMMNTGVLAQGLGQEMVKYDVNAQLDKGVESIGSVVEILRKNGVLTTDSQMNNPEYKKSRDLYVDSMISNPRNVISIMGDYLGGYNAVDDQSKAGGKNIYRDVNGNFIPTDEQIKEVKEKLTSMFDARVSKKATPMPVFAPTGGGGGGGGSALAKETELGNNVKRFLTGTGLDSKSAAQIIGSQNPNIRSLTKENGVIKISMNDGGYQEFDLNQEGANAEIIGRGLIGFALGNKISNVDQVLKRAGITPTLGLSLDPVAYEYQQGGKTDVLSKTQIISPDGKLVFASNALNEIDPDAEKEQDLQAILSLVDPRLTVSTENNYTSKDRLTLYLDGQEVNTIDYDDPKDRIELIKLIDKVRTQGAQGATQQNQSGQVDYTQFN
jgi:hypothetical protein